jgi:hypothetical protein
MFPALRAERSGVTSLLCPRDEFALRLLAAFRCLSGAHLEQFLDPRGALTPPSRRVMTFRTVRRLRARGLVASRDALPDSHRGVPFLAHALTPKGRRVYAFLDARYPIARLRAPSPGTTAHCLLIADIALTIRGATDGSAGPRMTWECDWETVSRIGSTLVVPDALLTYERDRRRVYAFVEADRATERGPAFAHKVARYLRLYRSDVWRAALPVWPLVLTITTTTGNARHLSRTAARAVTRAGETQLMSRFCFTTFDELSRPGGPFARIWRVAGRDGEHAPPDGGADEPSGASR